MCGCIKLKYGRFLFFFLTSCQRKRKRAFFHKSFLGGATHFMEEENDQETINDVARVVGVLGDKNRKPRGPTRDRNVRKKQWTELYNQNKDEEFSEKMRINHTTFNLLLNTLWDGLILTPTNFVLEPTSPDRQLPASLYRLTHRLGRRFWYFKRIGMRIFQQGNSPYSCLLLRRIREVA